MSSLDNLHYEKIGKETRCIEDEILFEIPKSWSWVRLREIAKSLSAGGDKPADFSKDKTILKNIPVVANGEYNDGILGYTAEAKIKEASITISGRGTIGFSIVRDYPYFPIVRLLSFSPYKPINIKYINYGLNTLLEAGVGTSIKQLTIPMLAEKLLPIPPLQEQKRIVDKLEEILPLVEKYKENKGKLDELNSSFPSKLKKSILDYAIKGKLVKQNLEDESVEILLQKIREEKQRLVKDKKIKADKFPQSTIFIGEDNSSYEKIGKETRCIADEIPFEIPQSWSWVRLGEICDIINGFTPLRSNMDFWQNGDIPWFTIDDMRECGRQISSTRQFISQKAIGENSKRLLPPNSILLCCTASIGEYAITKIPLTTNQQFNGIVIKTKYKNFCNAKFLFWVMPTIKSTLLNLAGKTTFEFVSVQKVSQILIPLPPLPEQKRIVAKIEELLKFVDILQSSLK